MSSVICGPLVGYRVAVDREDGEPRWCFKCRMRQEFRYKVEVPIAVEDMLWGPIVGVYCADCKAKDGDLFPGRIREWEI